MWIAAIELLAILVLLFDGVRRPVQRVFEARPHLIWLVLAGLAGVLCAAAAEFGTFSFSLAALAMAYTFAPAVCLCAGRARTAGPQAGWREMVAMLLLWGPLEAGAGESLIARPMQGRVHAVAYGVAILLALVLFLLYREFPGMKYNLPRRVSDLGNAAIGFVALLAALIPLGLLLHFLERPHASHVSAPLTRIGIIFAGTALPEEILFRALIQNWLMQRFGSTNWTILAAALIFGCAHLDNAPGPLPNWRYAILAAIAGFVFGKVFQKSSSVIASALVHTAVNTTKHLWF
jgi:membrane protease YdiL (CAAX protease family)